MKTTRILVLITLLCYELLAPPMPSARGGTCGSLPGAVGCGVSAQPDNGAFHGVIAVAGEAWVLDLSSRAGTTAGCGDCSWTVVLDCPHNSPSSEDDVTGCAALGAGNTCPPDRLPYRLYLTTSDLTDKYVGSLCLGGTSQILGVDADASADVHRYLQNVTPPALVITTRPSGPTLTGLPTYFTASAPDHGLGPVSFGSGSLSEAITLVPRQMMWQWGDGEGSDWMGVGLATTHRYLASGTKAGTLITQWSATYTATFDGHAVGPFDALGAISHDQAFTEDVDTSSPVLVSGSQQLSY